MKRIINRLFFVSIILFSMLIYVQKVNAEVNYGTITIKVVGKEITGSRTSVEEYEGTYYDVSTPEYGDVGEKGIRFEIYANGDIKDTNNNIISRDGELVDVIVTGEDGIAKTRELPIGSYKVVDTTSYDDGTENISPVYVVISDSREYSIMLKKGNGSNPTSNVTVKMEEFSTTHGDAIYGIYTKNPIKAVNGYACIYADECVGIAAFNDNCLTYKIDLPKGEYYIKELRLPFPYEVSLNEVNFGISDVNIKFMVNLEPLAIRYSTLKIIPIYYTYDAEKREKEMEINELQDSEIERYLRDRYEPFPDITYNIYTDENKQDLFATVNASNEYVLTLDRMLKGRYYVETLGTEAYENIYRFEEIEEFSIRDEDGDLYLFQYIQLPEIEYPPVPYLELEFYYDDGTIKTDYAQDKLVEENGSIEWRIPNMNFEITDEKGLVYLHTITDEEGRVWIPYDLFKYTPETLYFTIIDSPYETNIKPNTPFTFNYGEDMAVKIPISVTPKYGLKGDLDFNGVIDANDASLVLEVYKKENWTSLDLPIADMDNNNVIDSNDASLILEYYKTH